MRLKEINFKENPGEDAWKTIHTNAAHATLLFAAPGLSININYYANSNRKRAKRQTKHDCASPHKENQNDDRQCIDQGVPF